jgi:hypothetical protein
MNENEKVGGKQVVLNSETGELIITPETEDALNESEGDSRKHWKENPPTLENNIRANIVIGSKGLESLATKLGGSSDESDRATALVLAELSKSLLYDGHTAILANTILSKFTLSKEIPEIPGKEEIVEDINKEKEKLEALHISDSEEIKFTEKILEILTDALHKGKITELANIVSVDYPQAFLKKEADVSIPTEKLEDEKIKQVDGNGTIPVVLPKGTLMYDGNIVGEEGNSERQNLGLPEDGIEERQRLEAQKKNQTS